MRLLVADDDSYTREGIVEIIPWNDYEITEIMQAKDGEMALAVSQWFKPDIILTDIKMPKLDGIEFVKKIIETNPICKVLFMSGYMEIEYLKKAIQLSALAYIEKPIAINTLTQAVEKAVKEIRQERNHVKIIEDRKELQSQKLANMLISKNVDRGLIEELCRSVGFPKNGLYICVLLWKKTGVVSDSAIINEVTKAYDHNDIHVVVCRSTENRYTIVISYSEKVSKQIKSFHQKLIESIDDTVIGVGFQSNGTAGIHTSFQTAEMAINHSFYDTQTRFFELNENALTNANLDLGVYNEFQRIITENPSRLTEWMKSLFQDLYRIRYNRKEHVLSLLTSIVTTILREHSELYVKLDGYVNENNIDKFMKSAESLAEIEKMIMNILHLLMDKLNNSSKYSKLTLLTIDYICQNYMKQDLVVKDIANHLHFTPTYVNIMFKNEMNTTLKQYIVDYRMEMAKKILESTSYKINEIAEMCGYGNANYFAKSFKENTGLTPIEYKEQRKL